ncbi:transcription coactivator [Scheffersomyces coipomensis]|uniref:transcription coactivator n=1 Tax=Scheffersomyces coipomensis TaxID=1788519 RepID=UPI00315D9032
MSEVESSESKPIVQIEEEKKIVEPVSESTTKSDIESAIPTETESASIDTTSQKPPSTPSSQKVILTLEQLDEKFQPTTIVLAKVKGYPAWPAMVLEESILPEHIIAKRPKSSRGPSTSNGSTVSSPAKKKRGAAVSIPSKVLPVRFFSDDTYIWINSNDLKLLSKDDISAHFSNTGGKRRKDNLLEKAYELANDPPDMELFVKYGSRAAPPSEPEIEEIEEEVVEVVKPKAKKAKTAAAAKPKAKSKAAIAAAAAKAKKAKEAQIEAAKKKAAQEKKLALEKKKQEEKRLLSEYDDDWGVEDINNYDFKSGNYIFDNENEQNNMFGKIIPNGQKLQTQLNKTQTKFEKLSDKLNESLLLSDDERDDVANGQILDQLQELQDLLSDKHFPKTLILKSKLFRVLILTVRKSVDEFNDESIKEKISSILIKFLNIEVEINDDKINSENNSTIASKAESQEPESFVKSENGSTRPSTAT